MGKLCGMFSKSPLAQVSLRRFEPKTAQSQKETERKKELCDALSKEMGPRLHDSMQRCRSKDLSVEVTFYLWDGPVTGTDTRTKKDLDNLLKILCDVLPEHMDNQKTNKGLGLISDDSCIFDIRCKKEIVNTASEEGLDLRIYEH